MAQYLAEETVKIANGIAQESGADLVANAQREADKAKAKLDELQTAYTKAAAGQPGRAKPASTELRNPTPSDNAATG